MKSILLVAAFFLCVITARATDFKGQVTPVLQKYCYKCHSEIQKKEKGKLVMDNVTRLATKIGPSAIIKPGDPDGSTFYTCLNLPAKDDDHMPPAKEAQPPKAGIDVIKAWIAEGASLDGKKVAVAPAAPAPPATPSSAPAPAAAPGAAQTWTSADGKSIQASFLRVEGENIVIQRDDGVAFILPLTRLSPESQAQAKSLAK
ncbi:MAG TPA: c-type cytochrome domain-containing protein [Verrucomicrobiaceae bacterium]|jgi:hypothetical protein